MKNTATYCALSPAKINLFLHIHQPRSDGYHNLNTYFQLIDLYDEIRFSLRVDGQIHIDNPSIQAQDPTKDLCYQAAKKLQSQTKCQLGIDISVKKHIPIGGGLGGGSSNAATVLYGLNRLWETHLEIDELLSLALQIGSDVPIFLVGENGYATGRGEIITPAPSPFVSPNTRILIIRPNVSVSTRTLFHSQYLTKRTDTNTIPKLSDVLFENDFTEAAKTQHPEIKSAINALAQFSPAHLTGTGSCIYSVLDDPEKADTIGRALSDTYDVFVTNAITKSPLLESKL